MIDKLLTALVYREGAPISTRSAVVLGLVATFCWGFIDGRISTEVFIAASGLSSGTFFGYRIAQSKPPNGE